MNLLLLDEKLYRRFTAVCMKILHASGQFFSWLRNLHKKAICFWGVLQWYHWCLCDAFHFAGVLYWIFMWNKLNLTFLWKSRFGISVLLQIKQCTWQRTAEITTKQRNPCQFTLVAFWTNIYDPPCSFCFVCVVCEVWGISPPCVSRECCLWDSAYKSAKGKKDWFWNTKITFWHKNCLIVVSCRTCFGKLLVRFSHCDIVQVLELVKRTTVLLESVSDA